MGKRKRISDHSQSQKDHQPLPYSPSEEAIRCPTNMELFSDEKPSHSGDPGLLPMPPGVDVTDGSMKLNTHPTMAHHHQSLGRSIFLKRSRHYYGHHYSRRNSVNHANASSSHGKGISLYDDRDRLSFKLASQPNSQSRQHAEYREKTFTRPERIRSSSLVMDAVAPDVGKMVCGICQKPLRRKLNFLGSSLSCSELSVVAVLVCGHVYHADCLEQRTSVAELRDPSCPRCSGLPLQVHDSKGRE